MQQYGKDLEWVCGVDPIVLHGWYDGHCYRPCRSMWCPQAHVWTSVTHCSHDALPCGAEPTGEQPSGACETCVAIEGRAHRELYWSKVRFA